MQISDKKHIVRSNTGRFQGMVVPFNETFAYITQRKGNHYCYKHQGWGIQLSIFNDFHKQGVTVIIVEVRGAKGSVPIRHYSLIEDWNRFGSVDTLRASDGEQIFLHDSHFFPESVFLGTGTRPKQLTFEVESHA